MSQFSPDVLSAPMRLMGFIHRAFTRAADVPLRELGFAMGQLPVLVTLKKHPEGLSQAALARMASVEQPSMAQLLNRMERDGLVERVPDPADGRSRLISLTALASRRMPKGKAVMDDICVRALADFSAEEIEQLTRLLARVRANLGEPDPDDMG